MRKAWQQPDIELPFDVDEATGIRQWFSALPDGSVQLRQEMPVDWAEVEASKALQKNDDHWKSGVEASWLHYAHIPDAILFLWYTQGVNINEPSELLEMVNKPDWSYLKCVGKIHT